MSLIVHERLHAQSVDVCVMCGDVLACTFPYSCVCVFTCVIVHVS